MRSLLRPGFVPTDNPMFPVDQGMFADPFAFASPGTCFGPAMVAALPFISAGMTVLGAGVSAIGMIQQGNAAQQQAQLRNQQMQAQAQQQENEAEQNRAAGNNAAAIGQREAIEARRKGRIMAGRAQTVMAASGAGVDGSMTAGLLAEGDYAGDVKLWEGDERARGYRNAAAVNEYNAEGLRRGGRNVLMQGEAAKSASTWGAIGSVVKGVAGAGMGLAAKYGDGSGGGSSTYTGSSILADEDRGWVV